MLLLSSACRASRPSLFLSGKMLVGNRGGTISLYSPEVYSILYVVMMSNKTDGGRFSKRTIAWRLNIRRPMACHMQLQVRWVILPN